MHIFCFFFMFNIHQNMFIDSNNMYDDVKRKSLGIKLCFSVVNGGTHNFVLFLVFQSLYFNL